MNASISFRRLLHATLAIAVCVSLHAVSVAQEAKTNVDKSEKTEAKADDSATEYAQRFDNQVREDLFAGFGGDKKLLKSGMDKCEEVLKENPKHAEALVWRGAARVFLSGEAFQKKDVINGMKLWNTGLADMDKAKELEPENIGVLIPRAAVLLPAGRDAPAIMGKPVLKRVRDDFEQAYARQKDFLDKLGEHPHGELRMGLADVYRLMGESDKSKEQLEALVKELPKSEYADIAREWLKAPAEKKLAHSCIGCHSE
ncbi:MAG: hypothetical protein AAF394_10445 [Planctomycetota bacterium]